MKRITIFTPTYNREKLLVRLYDSLTRQNNYCFEWIVVDDDSTDNTEEWIRDIIPIAPFVIKYRKVKHGGKHRAINVGVELSETEFFFFVDSDDYLPDNATEIIDKWISAIANDDCIAGVSGLCMDPKGNIIGQSPNVKIGGYLECTNLERYRNHLLGDKAEVYKTSILKKYPFPEFDNEYFLTERIVWDKIASEGYKIRWYNEPVYICEYQKTGLSKSGANLMKGHIDNYQGYLAFIKQGIKVMEPLEGITYFREYNQVAKHKKMNISERAAEVEFSRAKYLYYFFIRMPVLYARRLLMKRNGRI